MAIVESHGDATPRGIQKRLERRNRKDDLAATVRRIRDVTLRTDMDDSLRWAEIDKIIQQALWR